MTENGSMSDCTLGKFMLFKDRRFKVVIKSKNTIELTSENDYLIKFKYYKEGSDCSNTDMFFDIKLKALDIVESFAIVNSTFTLSTEPKWNEISSCIRVNHTDTNYTVNILLFYIQRNQFNLIFF